MFSTKKLTLLFFCVESKFLLKINTQFPDVESVTNKLKAELMFPK